MNKVLYGILMVGLLYACKPDYSPGELNYIKTIEQHRKQTDEYMSSNKNSPFNYKGKIEFHPLNYFDVNPDFKFTSKLHVFEAKDTITIFGTKGEPRKTVRYGFITFDYLDKNYKLNVYQSSSKDDKFYYSIWFTDKTTNELTYGVGRYLDFDLSENPDNIYTIDFNLAYNPYCAYSKEYSCAIPPKEDYIDLAVTAGEKKFHD